MPKSDITTHPSAPPRAALGRYPFRDHRTVADLWSAEVKVKAS